MVGSGRNTVVSDVLFKGLVVVAFVAGIVGTAHAQAGPSAAGAPAEPNAENAPRDPNAEEITIVVGSSVIVRAPWPTSRVAVTNPAIAAVQVLTPEQVLVQGLKIGSTDLILWSEDERQTWQRRVVVQLDVQTIRRSLQDLFPGASLQISSSGEVLLVRGLLRSADQAEQLNSYLERSKVPYVDMTSVAGIQQVQLQVRVAEVSRRALRILGMNWFTEDEDFFFGQRLPGLGDIPVIGTLFRSVRYRNEETELIIVVTASLVEPINAATPLPLPGIAHTVPNEWELYIEGRIEGKRPAQIDPDSADWLRRMGLDQLVGPGAWDTYGYVPDAPPEDGT